MRAREFAMLKEIKNIASFLSRQTPLVTLPADAARARIFSMADRSAIERLVPQARGQTDHEALAMAKELLEKFLSRVRDGATLPRSDQRIVQGLYDIVRRQTDRYDTFMRQHGLDE
jgi:hypothetical protein